MRYGDERVTACPSCLTGWTEIGPVTISKSGKEAELAVEIITLRSIARMQVGVSYGSMLDQGQKHALTTANRSSNRAHKRSRHNQMKPIEQTDTRPMTTSQRFIRPGAPQSLSSVTGVLTRIRSS